MSKLTMYTWRHFYRNGKALYRFVLFYIYYKYSPGIAILDKHYIFFTDGLSGMYFASFGRLIVPKYFFFRSDKGNTSLMGKQNIAVGHQYSVTDLTLIFWPFVFPSNATVFHDVHILLFRFPGIKEIEL